MEAKRQKKILQIITKSNFGGAQKYVYELSSQLQENGYDVVVAFGGDGTLKDKLEKKSIKTFEIKSLQRDIDIFSDFKVFFELFSLIRKEKPDVVHLNSSKVGAIGSIASRLCFVPKIIFTIHGLAFNEERGFFSKILFKKIYFFTILASHYSIAVSENVKKQLIQIPFFSLLNSKIVVIKNAIKPIDFLSREESRKFIEEKINVNLSDKKLIGTIAELHHIKGLKYLIESSRQLLDKNPELIFVVIGEGEERKKLEGQIKDSGLENNFFLMGFIDEASKYMKAFDLFVLPSLSEGLALVVLEAKQANLKIVASKVGGLPEAIEDYPESILFQSKNSDDLTDKIEKILKSDLKINAEKFDYQNDFMSMVEKTLELYE